MLTGSKFGLRRIAWSRAQVGGREVGSTNKPLNLIKSSLRVSIVVTSSWGLVSSSICSSLSLLLVHSFYCISTAWMENR